MRDGFIKITRKENYATDIECVYENYYQIHVFSASFVYSTYVNKNIDYERFKENAINVVNEIQKRTSHNLKITLFESDGVMLISNSKDFLVCDEIYEFDPEKLCYDYSENDANFFEVIGKTRAETFIKNALISVGAERIIPVLNPCIQKIVKEEERIFELYAETRKGEPKYKIEIYLIEKDYKPKLSHEFLVSKMEALFLPEIKTLYSGRGNERKTALIRELTTNKIIDGSLNEAIESIKHAKWQKRNPSIIDFDIIQRMELDSYNPDFINYDDFVGNDDELEEGDEDYEPTF